MKLETAKKEYEMRIDKGKKHNAEITKQSTDTAKKSIILLNYDIVNLC